MRRNPSDNRLSHVECTPSTHAAVMAATTTQSTSLAHIELQLEKLIATNERLVRTNAKLVERLHKAESRGSTERVSFASLANFMSVPIPEQDDDPFGTGDNVENAAMATFASDMTPTSSSSRAATSSDKGARGTSPSPRWSRRFKTGVDLRDVELGELSGQDNDGELGDQVNERTLLSPKASPQPSLVGSRDSSYHGSLSASRESTWHGAQLFSASREGSRHGAQLFSASREGTRHGAQLFSTSGRSGESESLNNSRASSQAEPMDEEARRLSATSDDDDDDDLPCGDTQAQAAKSHTSEMDSSMGNGVLATIAAHEAQKHQRPEKERENRNERSFRKLVHRGSTTMRSAVLEAARPDDDRAASLGKSGRRRWFWLRAILTSGTLAFVGMLSLSLTHSLTTESDFTLILGSFGAEAVLLYAAPYSPFSQPRNVIGGHVVAYLVGMFCQLTLPGNFEVAIPLAVSLTIMIQMATDTIHPPGGGAACIAVLGSSRIEGLRWAYAAPVFISVALMLAAALLNNLFVCHTQKRRYPSGGMRKFYRW
jgi:CBS domain-containing membrane protein